jgi:hypothetical protein
MLSYPNSTHHGLFPRKQATPQPVRISLEAAVVTFRRNFTLFVLRPSIKPGFISPLREWRIGRPFRAHLGVEMGDDDPVARCVL